MSPKLVGILAAIFAANARVEGMKAENARREACGQGPAYTDEAFGNEAGHLDALSVEARNLGHAS